MFECHYRMDGTWNRDDVLHTLLARLLFHSAHSLSKYLFSIFHRLGAQYCLRQMTSTRSFQCSEIIATVGRLRFGSCKFREPQEEVGDPVFEWSWKADRGRYNERNLRVYVEEEGRDGVV